MSMMAASLNSWMAQANSAGVLDRSTLNALGAMAGVGAVPFIGSDGNLQFGGRDALALRDLFEGDIAFGSNSWRGDHYEHDLRNAIRKRMREIETQTLGTKGA